MDSSKWFLFSRRVWLRFSAVVAVVTAAAEQLTPEMAQVFATGLCAALGDRCDAELLMPRIVAASAGLAVLLKLWRTVDPDGSPPIRLRPRP